jgi:probable rRNA maturation factor
VKVAVQNTTDFVIHEESFEDLVEWLNEREPSESTTLSVALVGDDRMEQLHEEYYGERGTTDVLTFDYEDDTLEIVLNPFQQKRQAPEAENSFNEEVAENLLHGYLHGQGYDHTRDDGEHLHRQARLMQDMGSRFFPLVEESTGKADQ